MIGQCQVNKRRRTIGLNRTYYLNWNITTKRSYSLNRLSRTQGIWPIERSLFWLISQQQQQGSGEQEEEKEKDDGQVEQTRTDRSSSSNQMAPMTPHTRDLHNISTMLPGGTTILPVNHAESGVWLNGWPGGFRTHPPCVSLACCLKLKPNHGQNHRVIGSVVVLFS